MFTEKEFQVLKRRARGESQAAIARALGISQPAVSKFEKSAHRKILDAQHTLNLTTKAGARTTKDDTGEHVTYGGHP